MQPCDRSFIFQRSFEQTDGSKSSVEQTGGGNKSTRVLIPDQTGCCYFCATAHLPARGRKAAISSQATESTAAARTITAVSSHRGELSRCIGSSSNSTRPCPLGLKVQLPVGSKPRNPLLSPQCEKFFFVQSRKFRFDKSRQSEKRDVDVGKGTGPAEGPARSEETAHHAEAGRGRARVECALDPGTTDAGAKAR